MHDSVRENPGRKGKENDVVWQGMIGTKMTWYGKV